MPPEILVVDDERQLAESSAALIAEALRRAVADHGVFRLALAGGSTPRLVHQVLARESRYRELPWHSVAVFWGDERTVLPEHPDSNYRMAQETLLSKVAIDPSRVFRIDAEQPDPALSAHRYEQVVREAVGAAGSAAPRLDLVLLGCGPDGHTASLFPDTPVLAERDRLVVAVWAPALATWRITMTLPLINAAAQILFMVSGEAKAAAVAAALEPPPGSVPPPAALVQPVDGHVTWVLDHAAARFLRAAS